ncbi:MAG: VanZ family protein [Rubrivivax sp.]|nr:VanZ family protein [Rubrivivax sp.]
MKADRSLSGLLALAYLMLLVYASLHPFEGWLWPAGATARELLWLSWPPWRNRFDEWANLLGYLPFGAMLFAMMVRGGGGVAKALLVAVLLPSAVSYTMEVLQHFIPRRFPSQRDWFNNTLGALAGAAVAWLAQATGLMDLWDRLRERWLLPQSAPAAALLLIWPLGLLFPTAVPLGMGQIGPELRALVEWATEGTPVQAWVEHYLQGPASPLRPLSPLQEFMAIGCGLLAPCMLASAITRPGWRRGLLAPGAAAIALIVMTLSTALNFGPDHAGTWITRHTLQSLGVATALGMLLTIAGPRVSAALGLVALTAMVVLVAEAPADPYYAASLQGWEQGRFIHFHGLARWVGLLWPYVAIGWLVSRLARRG